MGWFLGGVSQLNRDSWGQIKNKTHVFFVFLTVMHGLAAWQAHYYCYIFRWESPDTPMIQYYHNTSLIIIIVIFNILWHAEFCNNIFAIYHPFQLQIFSSKFNLSISVLCNKFFVFAALNVAIRQSLCCFIDTISPQKILRFDVVSIFPHLYCEYVWTAYLVHDWLTS